MNFTGDDDGGERALELLALALETARKRGHDATGWMLQYDDEGFSAWLYVEDEVSQRSLFPEVDLVPTLIEAARICVARASALPPLVLQGES